MRGVFLAAAILVGSTYAAADEADLKILEGVYKVEAISKGTVEAPEDVRNGVTVTFKGDEMKLSLPKATLTAKIKVDGSKPVKTIDISPAEGPEKGKTFPGIYKIEDGLLTVAFNEKGDRPAEFKAEGDITLLKLKKNK